jgi:hypothetical protein
MRGCEGSRFIATVVVVAGFSGVEHIAPTTAIYGAIAVVAC